MSQTDLPEKESEEKKSEEKEKAETQQTQKPQEAEETSKDAETQKDAEAQNNLETESAEEIQDKAEEKAAAEQEAAAKPVIQVPLAPRCENPIIGRKVFFVNPPLYVENYLQPELKQHEYEAYIIKDYKYTKNALRMFPDALCFIFIDDEMSYDGWFNYILSFQQDEKLKTIFVGLMSAMIPQPKREKFMMNLSLPGGFIMLNEVKGAELIKNVIGILELNGAKGKRKYLRLDCNDTISINGYFATQTQLLQVSIANISSVGFTCIYPKSYGAVLAKKMVVPSFSITLGRRSVATPSIVFDVKSYDNNNYFAMLLFLRQVGPDDRKVIKNFIFEHMEKRLENLIYANPPDIDDYLGKAALPEEKDKETDEAVDEVEEIEEAEEVVEASEEKPADEKSSEEKPADEKSSEEKPSEEKADETKPAEDKPSAEKPADA